MLYGGDFKYIRQYCKDRNRVIRKLNNNEPIIYEEYKLLEVDIERYAFGMKRYVVFDFGDYDSLNGLVDVALEKWRQRL